MEGEVASSVVDPGPQALLVAGGVARVWRAGCCRAHVLTTCLGWHWCGRSVTALSVRAG